MPAVATRTAPRRALAVAAVLVLRARAVAADPSAGAPGSPGSEPDAGEDPALASPAGSQLDRCELDERPHGRTVDLLRGIPGLYAIQVDGGGQAEAYLVRGFDARSGLDLEVIVDGVPVNTAGPGRDHGDADTRFVIPDTVSSVALELGPYAARHGDFASAGALELHTLDELPGGGALVRLSSGTDLTRPLSGRLRHLVYRLTGMASPVLATSRALVAVELGFNDGPFVHPLGMHRGSLLAKWTAPIPGGEVQAAVTLFSGRAAASGMVPETDVANHVVDRFGALDPTLGDTAMRASASAGVTTRDATGRSWHLGAYLVASNHRLYTNPTVFLLDPDRGDQIEEVDHRTVYGLDAWTQRTHELWRAHGRLRLGVQARADDGDAEQWHDDHRVRLDTCFTTVNPCLRTVSTVRDIALYGEDTLRIGDSVTVASGLRLEQLTWDSADTAMTGAEPASGNAARARFNPKLGVTVAVAPGLEVSAMAGGGFRTSDTRAVIATDAVRAIPRIWAAELGARYHPDPRLSLALAGYVAWQGADARWLADRRELESVPPSRRAGIDAWVRYAPLDWLAADASLSVARGVSDPGSADQARLPLVPRLFGSGGIAAHRGASFVGLRGVGLGSRLAAAQPELTTPSQLVFSLVTGTRWRGLELGLSIENLFDARWQETQGALTVRSTRTGDAATDLVFSPGAPMTAVVTVGYSL